LYNNSLFKRVFSFCFPISLAFILAFTATGWHHTAALADSRPDLTITSIVLSPMEPAIDDLVTITVTVKNQGTAAAGASQVVCYIDTTILDTEPVGSLSPGSMATAVFTWQAQAGAHVVKATADSSGVISETDETNNTMTSSLTTLVPDLIVQSISWSPSGVSNGDNVIFNITVKNQGDSPSRVSKVNLYIDGVSRGYRDVLPIDPGSINSASYSWIARAGQHNIKAVIDDTNQVTESNETNNEYTTTFSTLSPDLIVASISWDPENPSKNDIITFSANITNQGAGRSDACQLAYYIDGSFQSLLLVGAIEAESSENVTFTYTAPLDFHEIRVIIDYNNTVLESDDTNNDKTVGFLTARPDLIIDDLSWEPEEIGVGDSVTFSATVKNQGAGRAGPFRVSCYVGSYYAGSVDILELDTDEAVPISFDWVASNGIYTINILADCDTEVTEINEANNKMTRDIPINLPDIWIPDISWSPGNPSVGDYVTFSVNMTNLGGGQAEGFIVAAYVDGAFLDSNVIPEILSGASVNTTFTWKIQNGRHSFRAFADYNQSIAEVNENNNEKTVYVMPHMPDLAVGTITWSPADMPLGSEVNFSIDIQNLGTLAAGHSRIAYYIDGAIASFTDIQQLNPGSVFNDHLLWVVTEGNHTIEIVTDSGAQVTEIDEDNNIKKVSIPLPDLVMTGISWSPLQNSIGDNVTFTATVNNQGGSRTQASMIVCYIDGYLVGSRELPPTDPGGSAMGSFLWTAAEGKHEIRILADSSNLETEIDETNNEKRINFSTLTPDLIIQDISWFMENQLEDDEVTLDITIGNQGSDTATACQLSITIDNTSPIVEDLAALLPNDSTVFTLVTPLKAGPHTIEVVVDSLDAIVELDETNNRQTLDFSTFSPDLAVKTISYSPRSAAAGEDVTITTKIENRGRDKAPPTSLALLVNGTPVDYAEIDEIDIGNLATVEFSWKAVTGEQEIAVCADYDGELLESNETNNMMSRSITITDKAPAEEPVNLTAGPSGNKGFLGGFWWLVLLVSAAFGAAAFVSAYKAFKKEKPSQPR
jgi:subtilase family serine protease